MGVNTLLYVAPRAARGGSGRLHDVDDRGHATDFPDLESAMSRSIRFDEVGSRRRRLAAAAAASISNITHGQSKYQI
jgi:hypothetical protein